MLGCGPSDPVGPDQTVNISMTLTGMTGSEIQLGIIDKDWHVNSMPGNPWANLIVQAVAACGGDPIGFEVVEVTIQNYRPGSREVESLDAVFSEMASVLLRSQPGNRSQRISRLRR